MVKRKPENGVLKVILDKIFLQRISKKDIKDRRECW